MEQLRIEDPGCRVSTILETLKKSPVVGTLNRKLQGIALAINSPSIDQIPQHALIFNKDPMVTLGELLIEWRSRDPSNATLGRFVEILESEQLLDFANLLRDKFHPDSIPGTSAPPPGDSRKRVKDKIDRQKEHITTKLDQLVENTNVNSILVAKMLSSRILSRADVAELNSITNVYDKSTKFYEILQRNMNPIREKLFDEIISALDEVRQTGASYELKTFYD